MPINLKARLRRLLKPLFTPLEILLAEPRGYLRNGLAPEQEIPLRHGILVALMLLYRAVLRSDLTSRAASTAYAFIFSLIPLLTTSLAFFTAIVGPSSLDAIRSLLLAYLLPGAVQEVQQYIDQFTARAATAGMVSSVIFFFTILLLMESLERTFNRIWKSERKRTWRQRIEVLALFFILGALVGAAILALTQQAQVLSERVQSLELTGMGPYLTQLGFFVAELGTAWVFFVVANRVLPNARVHWGPALVGGIAAGTVWHFLKRGFTWYVNDVAAYGQIYGAVSALPVFFLWVYLTFLLLLLGAYTAFVVQNLRALIEVERQADRPGQPTYYAVSVTAFLARAFLDRRGPLEQRVIARALAIEPYYVGEALEPLLRSGLVQVLLEGKEPPRYLLSAPPEKVTVIEVVTACNGPIFEVPGFSSPSRLHQRLEALFKAVTVAEMSALESVTIRDLADELPASDPQEGDAS